MKSLLVAVALLLSVVAQAHTTLVEALFAAQQTQIQEAVVTQGLNWKVGDTNNYKMNMGGFIQGTMVMSVREMTPQDAWLIQDVDMMGQKQKIEVLIDTANGKILKMIVNGKEQDPPKSSPEVIDQKEDRITVPAGTFDVIYLKVKDNANNGQTSEQWINPRDIPISGMAKSKASSQLGPVNIELTSFIKK